MSPSNSLLRAVLTLSVGACPLGALPLSAAHDGTGGKAPHDPAGSWIYYDWVENGELKGGRIAVDPADPFHAVQPNQSFFLAGSNSVTLVDNGPTWNRVDFVFVGDGYTAGEQNTFANDVGDILPTLLAEPPLDAYQALINVHRVDVVSNESGVDNDPVQGVLKDTALDMLYWCGGTERLLCVNVGKAMVAASNAPDVDQILALANSTKYGGAGYSGDDLATLAGDNFSSIEIALHELGHSLGDLADEYTYGGPSTYTGPEPSSANLSKKDSGTLLADESKWYQWIGDPGVGTYEGGGYSVFGVYRPTNNSKMRNLGRPFQQVNSEQMIVALYKTVQPLDDASAPGTYLESDVLWVDPVDPGGSPLSVQWSVDGVDLVGETGLQLDLGTLGLADGLYQVAATVIDQTPLVRDESLRAQYMTEVREWTVAVGDDPPPFVTSVSPKWAANTTSIFVEGGFLDGVLAVRVDGTPATIQAQAFDELKLQPAATAPGHVDLELDTLAGTYVFPGAVPRYPTLDVSTTGPGGTLTTALALAEFESGTMALFYGLGVYGAPIAIPDIHHGWLLDLGLPYEAILTAAVTGGSRVDVFPIPDNPGLAGLEIFLQAWAQKGALWLAEQSFTAAVPVTL